MLPAWIYVMTALMAGDRLRLPPLYKTLASREQVAAQAPRTTRRCSR